MMHLTSDISDYPTDFVPSETDGQVESCGTSVSSDASVPTKMSDPFDTDAMIARALEAGFSQAGKLNMESLVLMPEVRDMCAADKCHNYGKNWCCPPGCGSLEENAAKIRQYHHGILVQTIGQMEDEFDIETIQLTSTQHRANFSDLIHSLKEEGHTLLPMGAGSCTICTHCTYPDAPCRFPDKAIVSMEAYGLWVSRVCELSGVPYNNGRNTITYTSCILFR